MASFQTPAANRRQLSLHSSARSRSSRGVGAVHQGAGAATGGFPESNRSTTLNTPAVQTPSAAAGGSDELDEWIVFSPSTTAGDTTTVSYALSRASELGSIDARGSTRFTRHDGGLPGAFFDSQVEAEQDEEEEDEEDEEGSFDGAETDSLQPFREHDHEVPVMPTHDGLGTFPVNSGVITGLQSLEESLRVIAAVGKNDADSDLNARIQKWRLEQSQALLDEIERLTRRKRPIASGMSRNTTRGSSVAKEEEDMASLNVTGNETASSKSATPTQSRAGEKHKEESEETQESLWRRITRSFIRDIIGIDDALLQVIFGEALPAEVLLPPQPEPTPAFNEDGIAKEAGERLVNRIAKELGLFVSSYGAQSTGEQAFVSYARRKLDEEEGDGAKTPQPSPRQKQLFEENSYSATSSRKRQRSSSFNSLAPSEAVSSVPQFQFVPTLSHHRRDEASHAALWGIEERNEEAEEKLEAQIRKEYWEQELDVRVFFSFLKDRFSSSVSGRSSKKSSSSVVTSASSNHPPFHTHHPLINRNYDRNPYQTVIASSSSAGPVTRKPTSITGSSSKLAASSTTSAGGQFTAFGIRQGSSCASRSTNGKGNVAGSSKVSSRGRGYYWDVASSVGSGKTGSCVGTGVWAAI